MNKNVQKALALLLAASAGAAQAQSTRMMMPEGTYDMYLGVALGVTLRSASEGGNHSEQVPALSVQWSNGAFIDVGTREAVAGMHLSDNPVLDYGVLASMSGRDQRSDTPGERGGVAAQGGAFLYWAAAYNINVGGDLQAGGGYDRGGVIGHARATYSTPLAAHHNAELEAGMYVADHSWMQGYFGVTPEQAASGGSRTYRASAGLVNVYGDLEWQWQVANKYWLNTGARLSRLAGAAGASPLVGTRNRVSLRTSLTYHF
jgi:outer membrane protein